MRTTFDQETILYNILNGSAALKAAISGKIYRGKRPNDSQKEDISIVSLPILPGSIQFGTANVNIHVPDIGDFPDNGKLKALTDIVRPLLEETYGDDYLLYISMQQVFDEPEINQHYVNMRIEFEFHNTN
jgi:hypothetical protein